MTESSFSSPSSPTSSNRHRHTPIEKGVGSYNISLSKAFSNLNFSKWAYTIAVCDCSTCTQRKGQLNVTQFLKEFNDNIPSINAEVELNLQRCIRLNEEISAGDGKLIDPHNSPLRANLHRGEPAGADNHPLEGLFPWDFGLVEAFFFNFMQGIFIDGQFPGATLNVVTNDNVEKKRNRSNRIPLANPKAEGQQKKKTKAMQTFTNNIISEADATQKFNREKKKMKLLTRDQICKGKSIMEPSNSNNAEQQQMDIDVDQEEGAPQTASSEILTLKSGSWRKICYNPNGICPTINTEYHMNALAFVPGAFHWLGRDYFVVTFSISNEV
ncbi:hypothetical protein RND71_039843 [Anisodus tanguticus]|uniref:Uncharacterized protein n=1 Tax=Anisodus tanguticus TaxID=243964 RepID=A0AAE1R0C6_9SOLA|nr:hypothetical protein RND71_039843 [Anisodus tanguticus]